MFSIPQELHGDEQLAWAAAYVVERLTDEAEMLNTGLEQLNVVAARGEPRRDHAQEPNVANIRLQIGEDGPVVERVDITALRSDLAALKGALERWLVTTRERR